MTRNHTRNEIQNLLDLLLEFEIAIDINTVRILNLPSGRFRVTWASGQYLLSPHESEFGTIQEYVDWASQRQFSALLFDGAMLQISYDFVGNDVIGHRLLYYPCPLDVAHDWLKTEPLDEVMDAYRGEESYYRLRSPVRFDYDPDSVGELHPASHVTLNFSHCRTPVIAPLSLGHFIKFVFRSFYPPLWATLDFLREWPQPKQAITIRPAEETGLHFSYRDSIF